MNSTSLLVRAGFGLVIACLAFGRPQLTAAQDQAAPSQQLSLVARVEAAGMDAEVLRSALASELGVAVERVESSQHAHVLVEAASLSALHVAFVRADGSRVERTLDVASLGEQAAEAAALLAANLMRDEAGELLADLAHATAPPAPAPATVPAPAAAVAPPPPAPVLPRGCDANRLLHVPFGADFLPYLGMSGAQGARVERGISLNVLGGFSGGVRGIELAGLFNYSAVASCGFQLSSVANIVSGPSQGMQLSEINFTRGRLSGLQLGLIDIATEDVDGAQIGLVNVNAGGLEGTQLGLVNLTLHDVVGAQLGLINIDKGLFQGAQLGLVNLGTAPRGTQLGLVNLGTRGMDGAQLGLVNVTTGVASGLQLGLVNVAQDADAAIGLVSVLTRGRTQLDVWGTDASLLMVGVKHGGRRIYNIYAAGIRPAPRPSFAVALGLGARLWTSSNVGSVGQFFIDLDGIGYALFEYDRSDRQVETASIMQLRLPIGWQLTPWLAVVASPALNLALVDASNDVLVDPLQLGGERLTSSRSALGAHLGPGFTLGLRLF